ncbi:hypothetical protein PHYSODRAFT_294546 [Phytophthora sojae]|uniref:Uncharacterized protein n=1 Tax=Phytophthora sojae (strain P6497) TaxID=1094619 RepID=G4YQ30_PHYSP|nr:hypothetical protein PHYSODRAFT_294546 [Phytophthora sojae]EGZ29345.1 hypothetical protein PHYSODRAFT_294546 [Phytophthora sojae]|eukprot:XP_009516620.1 hypothetical protein PHYSODRAFT_294546 [Phytophthora sojae]
MDVTDLFAGLDDHYQQEQPKRQKRDVLGGSEDKARDASGIGTAYQMFQPLRQDSFRVISSPPTSGLSRYEVNEAPSDEDASKVDFDNDDSKHLQKQRSLQEQHFGGRGETDINESRRRQGERSQINGATTSRVDTSQLDLGRRRIKVPRRSARMVENTTTEETFDNKPSSEDQAECMKRLQSALGAEELDECVCTVCGRLVLCHKSQRVDDLGWRYTNEMKRCLKVSNKHELCDELINQYCSPPHLPALEGVMISLRGIHCYMDDSSTPQTWLSLPKFSIANGFFIGRLEKRLRGLTLPERFMTQLVSIVALTRVMRVWKTSMHTFALYRTRLYARPSHRAVVTFG